MGKETQNLRAFTESNPAAASLAFFCRGQK
jgi:hypothetical protein